MIFKPWMGIKGYKIKTMNNNMENEKRIQWNGIEM